MPKTNNNEPVVNVYELAEEAEAMGYDSIKRVADRLERIIHRNMAYLGYRRERGRRTSHDEITAEDCLVLAKAITLLEGQDSIKSQGGTNARTKTNKTS